MGREHKVLADGQLPPSSVFLLATRYPLLTTLKTMSRTVAIVGRPNVGKSRLFNRLAKRRISIVHDQPGVTRDVISAEIRDGDYTLLDTGASATRASTPRRR